MHFTIIVSIKRNNCRHFDQVRHQNQLFLKAVNRVSRAYFDSILLNLNVALKRTITQWFKRRTQHAPSQAWICLSRIPRATRNQAVTGATLEHASSDGCRIFTESI